MTSICAQGISITNIRCSGGAAALTAQLRAIYGTDLIGLWIGEDIVVDGSNNVTSWPGRVGGALAPTSATLYTKATVSGRTAIANTVSAGVVGYTATLSVLPKALFTVAAPTTLPFGNYNTAIWRGDNGLYLFGNSSTSEWYTVGAIYRNGATGISVGSGSNIYEADLASGSNNAIYVGTQTQVVGRSWLGTISFAMAIAAVPTALQRLQTQLALDIYYRPAVAPAAQLALDLYNILGADITGLWIGEDIVASGSNISYWPGRLGPVLMNSGVDPLLKSTLGSRVSTYNDTGIEVGIWATLSAAPQSVFAVIDLTSLPFVDTHVVVGSLAGPENTIVGEYTSTPNWMTDTGYAHYYNGASSELAHTGPGVYEGVKAGVTATDIRVGGFGGDYGGYEFKGKIACVMSLSAIPSAGNRAAVVALLRAYYGF